MYAAEPDHDLEGDVHDRHVAASRSRGNAVEALHLGVGIVEGQQREPVGISIA